MKPRPVEPEGWAPPRGYANGMIASGRTLHVAGQIGWGPDQRLVPGGLVEQFARALDNVVAVVRAAGGAADDIAQMTVYVTDVATYRGATREIGAAWRERLGRHYPAMALVEVAALVEPGAKVEIAAVAYLPESPEPPTSGETA